MKKMIKKKQEIIWPPMNADETRRLIKTADVCPEHDEGNADERR
jgi:hypothetical protein